MYMLNKGYNTMNNQQNNTCLNHMHFEYDFVVHIDLYLYLN